jgi:hypothetical protein
MRAKSAVNTITAAFLVAMVTSVTPTEPGQDLPAYSDNPRMFVVRRDSRTAIEKSSTPSD